MSGEANEYVFERGLVNADRVDLTGERLDQFGDELVAVGPLDANAAVQHPRLTAKTFTNLLGQGLGLARLHRDHVSADLLFQLPWRIQGHEPSDVQNGDAVAAI